jgi:hypothetical protein
MALSSLGIKLNAKDTSLKSADRAGMKIVAGTGPHGNAVLVTTTTPSFAPRPPVRSARFLGHLSISLSSERRLVGEGKSMYFFCSAKIVLTRLNRFGRGIYTSSTSSKSL